MSARAVGINQLLGQEVIDLLAEQFAVVLEEVVAVTGLAFPADSFELVVLIFRTVLGSPNLSLLSPVLLLLRCLPCLRFVCGH